MTLTVAPELAVFGELDIRHTPSSENDSTYNNLPPVSIRLELIDVDAILSVSELEVEEGGSATYRLRLTSQPAGEVAVGVMIPSAYRGVVTADRTTLTLDEVNWSEGELVTVTLKDDVFFNERRVLTIGHRVTDSDDPNYRGLEVPGVEVTLIDDEERPELILSLSPDNAREGSSSDPSEETSQNVTVRATAMLEGDLRTTETVVALAVGGVVGDTADEDDYQTDLPTDATLTIPAMEGSASLTFHLTLIEDLIDEGDQSFTITASNDLLGAAAATFVIADDDRAGVAVTLTPQNLHEGEEIPYRVVLESEPTADVEVAVAVMAVAGSKALPADVTAMPAPLTFTPANWHEPQTVTLTVAPGLAVFGGLEIRHTPSSQNDSTYNNLPPVSIRLELTDVDAILSVSELEVEEGGSATYRLRLTSQPAGEVAVGVMIPSAYRGVVTADKTTLTLDEVNWSEGELVTVTLKDDVFFNERRVLTIGHRVTDSDDPNYRGLEVPGVEVTLIDDEERPELILSLSPDNAEEGSSSDPSEETSQNATVGVTAMLKGDLRTTETVVALAVGGVAGDTADEEDYQTDLPTELTIPAMEGSASLTFNLTLIEDLIDEGDQSFTITAFNDLLGAASATFVIADDDRAGVAVALTPQNLHEGEELPYTVVLESEPTADVEVAVAVKAVAGSKALPTDVTAMPAPLTFTPANWFRPQTVTLTAAPELAVFGELEIRHTPSSQNDSTYNNLPPVSIRLELTDVDTILSVSELRVEEGGSAAYRLSLASQPASEVAVGVMIPSAYRGVVTADRTTLTLNEENWSEGEVVTVTLKDDVFFNERRVLTIGHRVTDSDDPNYRGLEVPGVEVTLIDDEERPELILSLSPDNAREGSSSVPSEETSQNVTVRATAMLEGDLRTTETVVALAVGGVAGDTADEDDYQTDLSTDATLIIPAMERSAPLTFNLTLIEDLIDEGDQSFTITASNDLLGAASATFAIADDDRAGVAVALRPQNLREGREIPYTVVLESEPTADVEVAVAVMAVAGSEALPADVTAMPAPLTFTPANWHEPQTVILTVAPGLAVFGELDIVHILTSADPIYDGLAPVSVRLELIYVDAILSVSDLGVEEGGSATYRLRLTSQPAGEVAVGVMIPSAYRGVVTADRTTLTLDEGNWSEGEVVTVTLEDDVFFNERRVLIIGHRVTDSGDPNYRGLEVPGVEVTLIDDEERPELILSLSPDNAREGSSSVPSEETSQNVTVRATAMLEGDLRTTETVVALAVGGVAGDTADEDDYQTDLPTNATLTIPAMEGSAPLTFNLTLIEDLIDEGDQSFTITASNDLLGSAAATFAIADDDRAGVAVALTPQNLREGREIPYTVVLESEPTADVEVAVAVMAAAASEARPADVTAMPAPLTFTSANWHEPQTVILTVALGLAVFGELDIVHILTSADPIYDGLAPVSVRLELTDVDAILSVSDLGVEEGGSATYRLRLTSQPAGEVAVGVMIPSAYRGVVTADQTTLTLNEGNWSEGEAVTVTLEDDVFFNERRVLTIGHRVTASDDPDYRGLEVPGVEVTLIDDEERPELILSLSPDNAREGSSSDPSEETSQNATVRVTAMLEGDLRTTETVVALAVGGVVGDTADEDDYQTDLPTNAALTIPAEATASEPLGFVVTLFQDLIDEGDQSFTITAFNDLLSAAAATFVIADDDRAGVAVALTPQNLHEGEEIPYRVVLESEPTADVKVAVAVMAATGSEALPADVTAMPAPLTFTPANWHEPQTVILTVAPGLAVFGELEIRHTPSSENDSTYNNLPPVSIRLELIDVDTALQSLEVRLAAAGKPIALLDGAGNEIGFSANVQEYGATVPFPAASAFITATPTVTEDVLMNGEVVQRQAEVRIFRGEAPEKGDNVAGASVEVNLPGDEDRFTFLIEVSVPPLQSDVDGEAASLTYALSLTRALPDGAKLLVYLASDAERQTPVTALDFGPDDDEITLTLILRDGNSSYSISGIEISDPDERFEVRKNDQTRTEAGGFETPVTLRRMDGNAAGDVPYSLSFTAAPERPLFDAADAADANPLSATIEGTLKASIDTETEIQATHLGAHQDKEKPISPDAVIRVSANGPVTITLSVVHSSGGVRYFDGQESFTFTVADGPGEIQPGSNILVLPSDGKAQVTAVNAAYAGALEDRINSPGDLAFTVSFESPRALIRPAANRDPLLAFSEPVFAFVGEDKRLPLEVVLADGSAPLADSKDILDALPLTLTLTAAGGGIPATVGIADADADDGLPGRNLVFAVKAPKNNVAVAVAVDGEKGLVDVDELSFRAHFLSLRHKDGIKFRGDVDVSDIILRGEDPNNDSWTFEIINTAELEGHGYKVEEVALGVEEPTYGPATAASDAETRSLRVTRDAKAVDSRIVLEFKYLLDGGTAGVFTRAIKLTSGRDATLENDAPQYRGMTELTVYKSGDGSVLEFPLSVVDLDGGSKLLEPKDLRLEVVGFRSEVFFVQDLDYANSYFTLRAGAIKQERLEGNGNSLALTLTLTGKLATPFNSVVELLLFGVTDGFYDFEQRLTVEVKNRPLEFKLAQTRRIKVFLEREPVTIPLAKLEPGSRVFVLEAPDDMVVKFDEDAGDYGAITLRRLAMDLDEDELTDEVKLVAIDAQGGREVATITVERPPLLPYIVPPNPRLIAAGELRTWSLRLERNTELDVIWDVTGGPGSVDYEIAGTAGGHAELTLSASASAQVGDEFELLLTAEVGAEDGGYRRTALLPVAVVAAKAKPHLKLSVTVPDAADPAKAVTVSSFALSESISVKAELEGAVPSLEDLGNVATLSFQIRVAKLGSDGVPSGKPLIFMAESRVEDGATALDIAPVLVGNLTTSTLGLSVGSVVEVSIGHLPWTDSTEVSDEISDEIIAGASLRLLVSKAAGRRDADNDGLADGGESEPGALGQIVAAVAEVPDGVVALQRNTASLSLGNVARSLGLGQCGALSLTLTLMLSSDGVPSAVLTGCGGAPVDSSQLSTEISAALAQFPEGEDYQIFDHLATFDSSEAGAGGEPLVVVIDLPVDPGTYNVYRYDEGRGEWVLVAVLSGQPGLEGPGALAGIDDCRSCFYALDFDRDGSVELLLLLEPVDPAEAEASLDYAHPDPDFRGGWIYVDVEETLTIELLNLGDGLRVEVTGEAIDLGYVRGRYVETAEGPVVELRALKRTNGPEEVLIEAFNESGEAVATITLYVSVRNQAPEIEFRLLLSGEPTTSIALPPNTETVLVVMILDPDGDTDFDLELTGGGDVARLEPGANPTVEVDSVSGGSVVINRLILTSKGASPSFNLRLEATDRIDQSKSSGRLTVCVNDTGKCSAAVGGGGGTGSGSGGGGSLGPWALAALVLPLLLGRRRRKTKNVIPAKQCHPCERTSPLRKQGQGQGQEQESRESAAPLFVVPCCLAGKDPARSGG